MANSNTSVRRQQALQKVSGKLLKLPYKRCLIRPSRDPSRHSRACKRGPKHPHRGPKALLEWLRLEQGVPPCPAWVRRGAKPRPTQHSSKSRILTGDWSQAVKLYCSINTVASTVWQCVLFYAGRAHSVHTARCCLTLPQLLHCMSFHLKNPSSSSSFVLVHST